MLRDLFRLGPRVFVATRSFAWMPNWLWFLVASPLLHWAFGPNPKRRGLRSWFQWPRE